jgi:hypothetical protein
MSITEEYKECPKKSSYGGLSICGDWFIHTFDSCSKLFLEFFNLIGTILGSSPISYNKCEHGYTCWPRYPVLRRLPEA